MGVVCTTGCGGSRNPVSQKRSRPRSRPAPVVVADGHHRYEVALAYQEEQRAAGNVAGPHDAILAFVVELAEDQLAVAPIHRLLTGLPAGWEPEVLLEPWFDVAPTGPPDDSIARRMQDAGALALVDGKGTWLLRPKAAVIEAAAMDLDSSMLAVALAGLPGVEVRYQHGAAAVIAAVAAGEAQAGILLRPATVAQISAAAARRSDAAKDHVFHPEAGDGHGLPGPRRSARGSGPLRGAAGVGRGRLRA